MAAEGETHGSKLTDPDEDQTQDAEGNGKVD